MEQGADVLLMFSSYNHLAYAHMRGDCRLKVLILPQNVP